MADQGTEGLLSPFLRRQRFRAAMPFLKGRVLDVGCGTGALAFHLQPDSYFGIEIDDSILEQAKNQHPGYKFGKDFSEVEGTFDTIVSLAVIEHLSDPVAFLSQLKELLSNDSSSRIVITTPHPSIDWVHDRGAVIGLFSKHANEEHEELLDRSRLSGIGSEAGLQLQEYRRFLLSANQIAVYKK